MHIFNMLLIPVQNRVIMSSLTVRLYCSFVPYLQIEDQPISVSDDAGSRKIIYPAPLHHRHHPGEISSVCLDCILTKTAL